jgi:acetyltransferase
VTNGRGASVTPAVVKSKLAEIEAPHQADPVAGRNQLVQAHRPPLHLPALRLAQPRPATTWRLRRRLFGKLVEPCSVHGAYRIFRKFAIKLPDLVTPRRYFPASPQPRGKIHRLCAKARRPEVEIEGLSVQKMIKARAGVELILGAKKDPTFGAVAMVGSGGVATDVARDRAIGLPPLNERLIRHMLESPRLWPILEGYRGQPAVHLDRLIEVVLRFSCLIVDYPEIRVFEINPLLVTSDDVIGLDAAVFLDGEAAGPARDPYPHLAIRPYPEDYIRHVRLKDGTPVTLRSVRPEDEHRWHQLIATSSPDSIRFRFRSLFKKSTHQMAVEHCFIDYERDIGIVAEIAANGAARLVGAADLLADLNHDAAEFAVMVADPWQGKGLGGSLLDYCLELARRWGFRRVVAETHPENKPMRAVFQGRGFAAQVGRDDDVVYFEKFLGGRKKSRWRYGGGSPAARSDPS